MPYSLKHHRHRDERRGADEPRPVAPSILFQTHEQRRHAQRDRDVSRQHRGRRRELGRHEDGRQHQQRREDGELPRGGLEAPRQASGLPREKAPAENGHRDVRAPLDPERLGAPLQQEAEERAMGMLGLERGHARLPKEKNQVGIVPDRESGMGPESEDCEHRPKEKHDRPERARRGCQDGPLCGVLLLGDEKGYPPDADLSNACAPPRRRPCNIGASRAGRHKGQMTNALTASEGLRERTPALILGKGITALASMRCLGRRGIPLYAAGTTDDLVTRSRWYRPLPGTAGAEIPDGGLDARLVALDIERMVLLPTSDRWATAVSRMSPELAGRFPNSVAPPEILQRLVDKAHFARALAALDIPHPRTDILSEPGALRSVPAERLRGSFLKPTKSGPFAGVYGVKAIHFDDLEDAVRLYDDATGKGFEMMLQEYIPGPATRHCFVEGYIDRGGRPCGMLARRRIRMYPADFGNSTATETIPLSDVASAAGSLERLLRGIDYRGVFSAEFKHDERDGLFKILEVNARPWWFAGFAASCGLDVCDMSYRDALGERVEPVVTYAVGRRCIAPRLDFQAGLADRRAGRAGLWPLLRSWIGASQLVWSADDPRPSLGQIRAWFRSRVRRRLGW